MSNEDKTVKDKNIIKLARQLKKTGRLNTDDINEAEKVFNKMAPGEKKARFGESDDYQDMVANKLRASMGELFGTAPSRILQTSFRDRIQKPIRRPFRDDGTKPVLDSKGKPVKNLRQAAKQGGQFQEVDVIDLTTEMVIDE